MNEEYIIHTSNIPPGGMPELPICSIPESAWKNGMAVRMPNHLGDAVMAIPALIMLKKIVPQNCALTVIAPENQRKMYEALPDIVDDIFCLTTIHANWSISDMLNLRRLRLGVGVLFNNSFRDPWAFRFAGISHIYAGVGRCRRLLLTKAFNLPKLTSGIPAEFHHTNIYMAIAKALGAPMWDGIMPKFKLRIKSDEIRSDLRAICEHPKLLILAPGAAYGAAKRWAAPSFRDVAKHWIMHGGIVITVGSAGEKNIASEVLSSLDEKKVFNLCGLTNNMDELMLLIKSSLAVVANDSGIMHLAAAMGKLGVTPFGPTDPISTAPISNNWEVVYKKQACSPCRKRVCPKGFAQCMQIISAEEIIDVLENLLKKNGIVSRLSVSCQQAENSLDRTAKLPIPPVTKPTFNLGD